MPQPMSIPEPAKQLTQMLKIFATGTPPEIVLREAVMNGHEANARNPDDQCEKYVLVCKDWENPENLCVINKGGEYFHPDSARDHLNTLANSGNQGRNTEFGLAENFGHGMKISWVPDNSEGILYRTKEAVGDGRKFHFKELPSGVFGLADFQCPELEEPSCFPTCYNFSEYLSPETSGTEVVLKSSQSSWDKVCSFCSLEGYEDSRTGDSMRRLLSNRMWEEWGVVPGTTRVAEYPADDILGKARRITKIIPLKEQIKSKDEYGTVVLNGYDRVPDGTIAHYGKRARKGDGKGRVSFESGFVSFAWRKENYMEHSENVQIRARKLKNCGILYKPTEWFIVFELPQEYDALPEPNRKSLTTVTPDFFFAAFRQELPKKIQEWNQQRDVNINEKDVKSWLTKYISNEFKLEIPVGKIGGDDASVTKSGKPTGTGTKHKKKGGKTTKTRKKSAMMLKKRKTPDVEIIEDPFSPLVEFNLKDYTIYVNTKHPAFKWRSERIYKSDTFKAITQKDVNRSVFRYIAGGAWYRIMEVQVLNENRTLEERETLWREEFLEATWNQAFEKQILATLRREDSTLAAA